MSNANAANNFPVDIPRWVQLLKVVETLPPEPYAGRRSALVGQLITRCPPRGAPPASAICYHKDQVVEADARLAITDQERLNILKYFLLRFRLVASTDFLTTGLFSGSTTLGGVVTSGPNLINTQAASVRNCLYESQSSAAVVSADLLALEPKIASVLALASTSLQSNSARQTKLFDYIFPDAAVWNFLLAATNDLPACHL